MNTSCCTNPIRINTLLIKNRIVLPAMCTKYAAPDGGVTERMLRYYEERAKGGAGLVTIEATSVDPTGNSFSRGLSIANDARLPCIATTGRSPFSSSTAGAPRSPNFRAMPCLSSPPSPA